MHPDATKLGEIQDRVARLPGGFKLVYDLHGDFRQLFDWPSAEWSNSSLQEKQMILKTFEEYGVPREELLQAFKEAYANHRADIAAEADISLRAIELQNLTLAVQERGSFNP